MNDRRNTIQGYREDDEGYGDEYHADAQHQQGPEIEFRAAGATLGDFNAKEHGKHRSADIADQDQQRGDADNGGEAGIGGIGDTGIAGIGISQQGISGRGDNREHYRRIFDRSIAPEG